MINENEVLPLEEKPFWFFDAQEILKYFQSTEEFEWIQKTNVLTIRLKKIKIFSEQKHLDGEKKRVYI